MTDPEKRPYLSVVVMAYRRRTFLRGAIESLDRQTLDPSEFEVIVLKDFSDPDLDAWISTLRFRSRVLTEDIPGLGEMHARGVELASGEVVCFLDDDDRFRPERLEHLRDLFVRDEKLVYVHNAYDPIDSEGRPVPAWLRKRPQASESRTLNTVSGGERSLPWIQRHGGHANSSAMAIRAALLRPYLPWLRKVPAGIDHSLFAIVALSGGTLLFVPDRWTDYRVHASRSHPGVRAGNEDLELREVERLTATGKVLGEMVASRHDRPLAQRLVEGFCLEVAVTRYLLDPNARFSARNRIQLLRSVRWRGEWYLLVPWVYSFYRAVLPSAAVRSYRARRMRGIQERAG